MHSSPSCWVKEEFMILLQTSHISYCLYYKSLAILFKDISEASQNDIWRYGSHVILLFIIVIWGIRCVTTPKTAAKKELKNTKRSTY